MKPGYGKQKGSQFERDMCRALSLWISNNKNPNLLWRSAMSGGRSSLAYKKGGVNKEQAGDISAVGEEGHYLVDNFYIECKNYTDLGLSNFFINRASKLRSFWLDTIKAAEKNGKIPLVIAKESYMPPLLLTTEEVLKHIFFKKALGYTIIMNGNSSQKIFVSVLDDFLAACTLRK